MARSDSYEELINNSLDKIESWVEGGDTDKDIAEKLGIGYSTYRKYKSNNVALRGAIATGKDKANQEVEKSLLKICKGYKYYEEVATKVKTETRKPDGSVVVVEDVKISNVKKYKGPELNAQKFWLINRKNKAWKEDPNKVNNDSELLKLKKQEAEQHKKLIEGTDI
ncbi:MULTISPECIES: hypothetical protein [Clostridium]|uniref:hypothetical protein n=1 Tax=Clostridium TaxID=1485 RepID=UPI00077300B6|nr:MULTISPECIES: hypothetical protein [Clostridium]NFN09415.1 Xaa-His dipeptidase [Clostridium botulinum]NFN32905.1 Xaa-His dipeptidase [Clostridium botulinum]